MPSTGVQFSASGSGLLHLTINLSLGIQHHLLAFLGNHRDMYI